MTPDTQPSTAASAQASPVEVFRVFLKLGLTSFGGPIAHLGYFRDELVVRRRWIDEAGYADLVALCQFLPGPASSQVGFVLGLLRGGPLGALAAWTAFTLPSALLLVLFASRIDALRTPLGTGLVHGLQLVAVAIVAQAVWGMARTLAPDRSRTTIALAAVLIVTVATGPAGQVVALLAGAAGGLVVCRSEPAHANTSATFPVSRAVGIGALAAYFALLLLLPLLCAAIGGSAFAVFSAFYQAGALVFGGGHVVLPLLESLVVRPGWISADTFLAGYGAAQAVPGPLFTFAAYLGALIAPGPHGLAGAVLCLAAIFLPGLLVLIGVLPFWSRLRQTPKAQAALRGANAAVVGILAAALYSPVVTTAIRGGADAALAAAGFGLLTIWKTPPWVVVVLLLIVGGLRSP